MDAMRELVTNSNIYIDNKIKSGQTPNGLLLKNIATYITDMFRVSQCKLLGMNFRICVPVIFQNF